MPVITGVLPLLNHICGWIWYKTGGESISLLKEAERQHTEPTYHSKDKGAR